ALGVKSMRDNYSKEQKAGFHGEYVCFKDNENSLYAFVHAYEAVKPCPFPNLLLIYIQTQRSEYAAGHEAKAAAGAVRAGNYSSVADIGNVKNVFHSGCNLDALIPELTSYGRIHHIIHRHTAGIN